MKAADILLVITTVLTGLMAGLFYAFSFSVVLGLGKLPDADYIRTFQAINREIQNPIFLSCFMGILLLLPLSTYMQYARPATPQFWFLLAATLVYFIGVFGVTVAGNIPLNNAIEAFKLDNASADVITAQRTAFESKWNNLNMVRTIASTLTLLLSVLACLRK